MKLLAFNEGKGLSILLFLHVTCLSKHGHAFYTEQIDILVFKGHSSPNKNVSSYSVAPKTALGRTTFSPFLHREILIDSMSAKLHVYSSYHYTSTCVFLLTWSWLLSWSTCTMARITQEASTKNAWLPFSVWFLHYHSIQTISKFWKHHHMVSAWWLSPPLVPL